MISVVIDKNIFVSAFLRGGKPREILRAVREGRIILLITDDILDQLYEVLMRPKFQPDFEAQGLKIEDEIANYRKLAVHVTPKIAEAQIVPDVEDQQFIECALGGKADYIVSGDHHLLDLKTYREITILTPTQFLAILNPPAESKPQSD